MHFPPVLKYGAEHEGMSVVIGKPVKLEEWFVKCSCLAVSGGDQLMRLALL